MTKLKLSPIKGESPVRVKLNFLYCFTVPVLE